MANRPPAFQFYPADWLDFKNQSMPLEAQGAYMNILAWMWKDSHDQCSLLYDPKAIAKAEGISVSKMKKIFQLFFQEGRNLLEIIERDGIEYLFSRRLEDEARKRSEYLAQQSEKGKKSAEKRWGGKDNPGYDSVTNRLQPEGKSSFSSSIMYPTDTSLSAPAEHNSPPQISPEKDHSKSSKNKTTDPRISRAIKFFHDRFEEKFHRPPITNGGQAGSMLKKLFASLDQQCGSPESAEAEMKRLINLHMNSTDPYAVRKGHDFSSFTSCFEGLRSGNNGPDSLRPPPRVGPARVSRPESFVGGDVKL